MFQTKIFRLIDKSKTRWMFPLKFFRVKLYLVEFILLGFLSTQSWASPAAPLPKNSGVKNVKDFGAKGDGIEDDTEAIRKAIASTYQAWEQIYLPEGRYRVTQTIEFGRFLTFRGDGPQKTFLVLLASSTGYTDVNNPKSVLRVFRGCCNEGGAHDNTTHSAHIFNLTVEIQANNPGAIGIDFISHNGGGMENVVIKSVGQDALLGLSLLRDANGPAHFRHVNIDGFKTGLSVKWGVYSSTFDYLSITNFTETGIKNDSHPLSISNLKLSGTGIGIESVGENYGHLLLQKAEIQGLNSLAKTGIKTKGAFFLAQVTVGGFSAKWTHENTERELPDFGKTGPVYFPLDANMGQSKGRFGFIAIEERPEPEWNSSDKWTSVKDYENKKQGDNWSPAIQSAIDDGATTLFFPNSTHASYLCKDPIYLRGKIRRVVGLYARLSGTGCDLINAVTDSNASVYLEQVRVDQKIIHRSKSTLVLNRSMGEKLESEIGSGTIHSDDWCCGSIEIKGGRFFGRGINIESKETMLSVNNAQMWILGLKTEQGAQVGRFIGPARVELLGGLIYPVQGAQSVPMFYSKASELSLYIRGSGYPSLLEEVKSGISSLVKNPSNGLNVYTSFTDATVSLNQNHILLNQPLTYSSQAILVLQNRRLESPLFEKDQMRNKWRLNGKEQ